MAYNTQQYMKYANKEKELLKKFQEVGFLKIGRSHSREAQNIWKYIYNQILSNLEKGIIYTPNPIIVRVDRSGILIITHLKKCLIAKKFKATSEDTAEFIKLLEGMLEKYTLKLVKNDLQCKPNSYNYYEEYNIIQEKSAKC